MPFSRSRKTKETLICQVFAIPIKKTTVKNLSIFWGGSPDNLGERLNGIQEVIGSIPTVSTKSRNSRGFCFLNSLFFYPTSNNLLIHSGILKIREQTVDLRRHVFFHAHVDVGVDIHGARVLFPSSVSALAIL